MDPQLSELPLKDIHAAPLQAWWPPAPGWWVLAVLVLVLLGWLLIKVWRIYRRARFKAALWDELNGLSARYQANGDSHGFLQESSTLLRRLIVHLGGHREAAGLVGNAWAEYLAGGCPQDPSLADASRDLARGPYRPSGQVDMQAITDLVGHWIERTAMEARHV